MRAKDYIEAAYARMMEGVSTESVLTSLRELLLRKGLTRLYPRILKGILEKATRKEHATGTRITVAREGDSARYKDAIQGAEKELDAKGNAPLCIDPTIVGGFIVSGNGNRIDRSYKKTLLSIYERAVHET